MHASRTLIVMRHARAAELPGGADFDRPLRPGGRDDAAAAGRWLAARGWEPDLVLCSAALRTSQTWEAVAAGLARSPRFSAERGLYLAGAREVAELISEAAGDAAAVLYIGHNPAAGQLAAALAGPEAVPEFPTAAIAVLGVRSGWADLAPETCGLLASWTPSAQA